MKSPTSCEILQYDANRAALNLIKMSWPTDHGNKQVGCTWRILEQAIADFDSRYPSHYLHRRSVEDIERDMSQDMHDEALRMGKYARAR